MTQPDSFEMTPLTPIVDVLAAALSDYWASTPETETTLAGEIIAILNTPEMQAIRRVLRAAWGSDIETSLASVTRNLRLTGLPESVVQWVVDE